MCWREDRTAPAEWKDLMLGPRALSLWCCFLCASGKVSEMSLSAPPAPSRPSGSPRVCLQLELSLQILHNIHSGSLISQGLFWKSWRQNDFSFNLLLFLILKLCFVFKNHQSPVVMKSSEHCQWSLDSLFGNSLKFYSLWSICIYALFSKPPLWKCKSPVLRC